MATRTPPARTPAETPNGSSSAKAEQWLAKHKVAAGAGGVALVAAYALWKKHTGTAGAASASTASSTGQPAGTAASTQLPVNYVTPATSTADWTSQLEALQGQIQAIDQQLGIPGTAIGTGPGTTTTGPWTTTPQGNPPSPPTGSTPGSGTVGPGSGQIPLGPVQGTQTPAAAPYALGAQTEGSSVWNIFRFPSNDTVDQISQALYGNNWQAGVGIVEQYNPQIQPPTGQTPVNDPISIPNTPGIPVEPYSNYAGLG